MKVRGLSLIKFGRRYWKLGSDVSKRLDLIVL